MKNPLSKKQDMGAPGRRRTYQSGESERQPYQQPVQSFRRNRTLTGSSSAQVKSTNEMNAEFMSPRAHAHHLARRRRHLILRLFGVLALALIVYAFASQLVASVTLSQPASNITISDSRMNTYEKTIDSYLNSYIDQRFFPSLNAEKLTSYLQAKYTEIKSVDLSLTGEFGKAQASLTFRKPVAQWVVDGMTQYVDDSGVVFDYSAYSKPKLKIIDENGQYIKSGSLVASHKLLAFVGQMVGDAKHFGFIITKTTLPLLTTQQVNISVKGVPYYFKTSVDRSAGDQTEDIARIITYLNKKSITPSYIDIRVSREAFYQ